MDTCVRLNPQCSTPAPLNPQCSTPAPLNPQCSTPAPLNPQCPTPNRTQVVELVDAFARLQVYRSCRIESRSMAAAQTAKRVKRKRETSVASDEGCAGSLTPTPSKNFKAIPIVREPGLSYLPSTAEVSLSESLDLSLSDGEDELKDDTLTSARVTLPASSSSAAPAAAPPEAAHHAPRAGATSYAAPPQHALAVFSGVSASGTPCPLGQGLPAVASTQEVREGEAASGGGGGGGGSGAVQASIGGGVEAGRGTPSTPGAGKGRQDKRGEGIDVGSTDMLCTPPVHGVEDFDGGRWSVEREKRDKKDKREHVLESEQPSRLQRSADRGSEGERSCDADMDVWRCWRWVEVLEIWMCGGGMCVARVGNLLRGIECSRRTWC